MKLKKVKLEELGEIVGGSTPSTKNEKNYGGTICWITPKDLSDLKGRYINRGERNITEEGYKSTSTKMLPINSVLFSSRAPIGYIAINNETEVCTNQGFKSIVPNEKTDYMFLYYLLKYNKNNIVSLSSGTTFKEISGTVMKNIEVYIPEKEEQIKIAKILSTIDDKIELNTKINDNLRETIKQYIKEKYYLNHEIEYVEVSKYGKIQGGYAFKSKDMLDKVTNNKVFKIKNIASGHVDIENTQYVYDEVANKVDEKYLLTRGDVIIAMTGAELGKTGYLYGSKNRYLINQRLGLIRGSNKKTNLYLCCLFLLEETQELIHSKGEGSAQPNISTSDIERIHIPILTEEQLEKFWEFSNPIYQKMIINMEQNQTLKQLRDTLLPKLMKGEIDLENVEI